MITVTGRLAGGSGEDLLRFLLGHGEDPAAELAGRGWAGEPVDFRGRAPDLEIVYAVRPTAVTPPPPLAPSTAPARQRTAAYALVVAGDRVLLTQLSERVLAAAGLWLLPGGGLDLGEGVVDAVVREVREETGQHVEGVRPLLVSSQHRVDPLGDLGPSGDFSANFHAVRLICTAHCPRPTEPAVLDVGGSTAAAAWVPWEEVLDLALVPWARQVLTR